MIAGLDGLRFQHWQTEQRHDGVMVLSFDRAGASVNTFSQEVLIELDALLERLALDPPKGLVLRSAKATGFIAGADIKEFAELRRQGQRRRRHPPRPAGVPATGRAALPHRRRDPRLLHGRRHRNLAGLPLPRRQQRRVHPHRPAGSEARHLPGLGRQRAAAAPGRRAGRVRHDADRPHAFGLGGARHRPGRQGGGSREAGRSRRQARIKGTQRPFKQRFVAWATNILPARKLLAPMLVKQVARKARKEHYPAPYALISTWERAGGGVQSLLAAERKAGGETLVHADRAQPDPRVLPAGTAEVQRRQGSRHQARARRRRRRDGRRYRGLVGLSRVSTSP